MFALFFHVFFSAWEAALAANLITASFSNFLGALVAKKHENIGLCFVCQLVTHVECRGRYCDDLRLKCAKPISWQLDSVGNQGAGQRLKG